MRRLIWGAVVALLAFGVIVAAPPATTNSGTSAEDAIPPAAAGCVVSVGRGQTGAVVFAGATGLDGLETNLSLPADSAPVPGGEGSAGSIPIDQITPSGAGAALLELAGSGGGTVVTGGDISSTAANCTQTTGGAVVLTGISTANSREVVLVVANPYALDAMVDVQSISEVGADTASELESLVIPAGGVAVRDLGRILPLRNHLSLVLTMRQGTVHAVAFESSATDSRAVEGVPGNDEWWVLAPPTEGLSRSVTIVPAEPGATAYQIDTWSPDGVIEAAYDDVVPSGGQVDLSEEDLGSTTVLRVITTTPSVVGLALDGEGIVAGGPVVPGLSSRWLLAGAGTLSGATIVRVFNPQPESVSLVLLPLDGSEPLRLEVAGGSLRDVDINLASSGFVLDASAPVAAAWLTSGVGLAYSSGIRLDG